MRRDLRILLATLVLGALWACGSRVMSLLPTLSVFHVRNVEVMGLDFVDRATVLRLLDLKPESSVWDDTDSLAEKVMEDPLVEAAEVHRRMPWTLVVQVTERHPVGLVPTPTLEAVDADGVRLPLNPAGRRVDLPIIEIPRKPAQGARLLPSRGRALVAEVARFQADTTFLQMVSEVAWKGPNTVVARWSEPRVDFLLEPGTPPRRIKEGVAVLADALGRDPHRTPVAIDLRYADQIVVRRTR